MLTGWLTWDEVRAAGLHRHNRTLDMAVNMLKRAGGTPGKTPLGCAAPRRAAPRRADVAY